MHTKNPQKSTMSKNATYIKNTYSNLDSLVKKEVMGIGLTDATSEEILEYLVKIIEKSRKNVYIVTPNPEIVMYAASHPDFKDILNGAELALCDGVGLLRAAQFMGKSLKERIIGTDFVEKICEKANVWPITVGFLGGREGVAEKAAECLLKKYPKVKVSFVGSEWEEGRSLSHYSEASESSGYVRGPAARFLPQVLTHSVRSALAGPSTPVTPSQSNAKLSTINRQPIDILFVAFGAPKQEEWMASHINKIPVRVMIGVGGAFDQIVDKTLRPPAMVHQLGLGWLYRLARQPWRLKRQLQLIPFMLLVLKTRFLPAKI